MALKGQVQDLPLLEVVQIVAFAEKSGSLRVSCAAGKGAVFFEAGKIVWAYSPSTWPLARKLSRQGPKAVSEQVIREQVQLALRELTSLQEGEFEFALKSEPIETVEGIDVSSLIPAEALDPQHLLLDLARELDEERRDAGALFEETVEPGVTSEAPQAVVEEPAPTETTLILVDDEPPVTRVVGAELEAAGYQVATAGAPGDAITILRERVSAGEPVLAIVDLRMPSSSGRSFFGGFEVARALRRNRWPVPVLLMIEKMTPKTKKWVAKLKVHGVIFKPALSKLDPDQYESDLKAFATVLKSRLAVLARPGSGLAAEAPDEETDHGRRLSFLKSMTQQLMHPRGAKEISRMVLRVASQYFERGVLFLVKGSEARGVAGFGLAEEPQASVDMAQRLLVDLDDEKHFTEVIHVRTPRQFALERGDLDKSLFSVIPRGRAADAVLLPVLHNREVLAILYGDNAVTGRRVGKLDGLELFLVQAAMALENVSLQRKLQFFASRWTAETPTAHSS